MRQPLVIANWKLNGSRSANQALVQALVGQEQEFAGVQLVICPPSVYLAEIAHQLADSQLAVGSQTVSNQNKGPYTGEIAASMLAECGAEYCIIGHSERRTLYGETDSQRIGQIQAALAADLIPVFCIGESGEQRQQGLTEAVLTSQLGVVIDALGIDVFKRMVIAYEPVWAINTGNAATVKQAEAAHRLIRHQIAAHDEEIGQAIQVLYGGSVKASNARELFASEEIDGGLIGGASLNAEEFATICLAAKTE